MKSLSIEEKAEAYDKVREKIALRFGSNVAEEIFSEFEESEDERIRKALIKAIKMKAFPTSTCGGELFICGQSSDKCITWLEKIGKQKPVNSYCQDNCRGFQETGKCFADGDCKAKREAETINKLEPKFKIGDWVVSPNGVYWHIDAIRDGRYQVSSDSGSSAEWPLDTNIYHKFTIQDAKDGDVLYSPSHHLIWIYKDNEHYYACVNMNYVTKDIATNGLIIIPNDACPATKDEQTILFARMKEADYEWDAEKKELKEIEHKHFCELDNSCACVKFPFKAKVKSTGTIVAIHGGQLSYDGKEWIKYQSDAEDGYKIYEPNDLELVCDIEQ